MMRMNDVRKKVLITIGLLIVSRIGTVIPIPGIDPVILEAYFLSSAQSSTIGFTEYLNFSQVVHSAISACLCLVSCLISAPRS